MTNTPRTSGLSLVVAGVLGLLFFWLTDPRWGWLGRRSAGDEAIDAVHQLTPGTMIGLAASGVALLIGIWLATRRAV